MLISIDLFIFFNLYMANYLVTEKLLKIKDQNRNSNNQFLNQRIEVFAPGAENGDKPPCLLPLFPSSSPYPPSPFLFPSSPFSFYFLSFPPSPPDVLCMIGKGAVCTTQILCAGNTQNITPNITHTKCKFHT